MIQGPDGSQGPHVFVESIDSPVLRAEDHHHLARSLRLRPHDRFTVADGRGAWRVCAFGDRVEVVTDVCFVPVPEPALSVGFALTKGAKPELVVQKLTELGIDSIVPFVAERSIARWDDQKARRQQERFERIAREASMQSRRVRLPEIRALADWSEVAVGDAVRADRVGAPIDACHTTVLIGPEGGWSDAERGSLPDVALGTNVLRAETAAIAAATLMAYLRSPR